MANVDSPFGLKPVRYVSGAPYNGAVNRYYVPASDNTAIFIGDAVSLAGSADADGVPSVQQTAAGGTIKGVVVGVEFVDRDSTTYREASTERYLQVADDPDLLFLAQEDSVGGDLAAANVGNNVDLAVGSGNTTTGLSGVELDSSSAGTGTAQVRLERLWNAEDNEIGTNAKWLVRIVEHRDATVTGV